MENTNTENKKVARWRELEGTVMSNKMDKTIVVAVATKKLIAKYKKMVSVRSKFHVHDEKKQAKVGDVVLFRECRPISKTKNWRLIKVVKPAIAA